MILLLFYLRPSVSSCLFLNLPVARLHRRLSICTLVPGAPIEFEMLKPRLTYDLLLQLTPVDLVQLLIEQRILFDAVDVVGHDWLEVLGEKGNSDEAEVVELV